MARMKMISQHHIVWVDAGWFGLLKELKSNEYLQRGVDQSVFGKGNKAY